MNPYALAGLSLLPQAVQPFAPLIGAALRNPGGFPNNVVSAATPKLPASVPTPAPQPAVPAVVRPPKLDYAAVQAQARQSAENAVNPYYTKQLNDFLSQQATQRQQKQQEYEFGVQNLQDQLKQTLEGNKIQQGRTTEDVAQNQADINQQADIFQTDTGQAADAARIAQARQLAQSGLTGGMGSQQQEAAATQRNTVEKRQEQQFQQQRQQQELFKTRTFEDLARSGELATQARQKGEKAAKFDLDSFIKNQGFETEAKKATLESQRQSQVLQEQQNQARLAYNQYLARIRDPAQLAAAASLYGGSF